MNLYAYAGNNPIAYTDPFGLCPWCVGAGIGAAVFGTVQLVANLSGGRPATENLSQSLLLGAAVGSTLGAAAPEATMAFAARIGMALGGGAIAATGSSGVSVAQSVERGLLRSGGKLFDVLRGIEAGVEKTGPKSAGDALAVVSRAAGNAGLEAGKLTQYADGSMKLVNVGNVVTKISATGQITVQRGADVLLRTGEGP